MGARKNPYPGPIWDTHGTMTLGMSSVGPVNGPNIDTDFCYLATCSSVGFVRVAALTVGDSSTALAANSTTFGPKLPESGLYYPCSNLKQLWFTGSLGSETVTIVYSKP